MNKMKIFLGCIISAVILSSCGMSEEAKNVKNMIDELPGSYSEDIDEDYKAAREAYEELSEEDQKSVSTKKLDKIYESKIDSIKTFGFTPEEFEKKVTKESGLDMFTFEDIMIEDKSKDKYEDYQDFLFRGYLGSTGVVFSVSGDILKEKNEVTEVYFSFYANEADLLSKSEVKDVYLSGTVIASSILEFITGMDDGQGFLADMIGEVSGTNTKVNSKYEDYSIDCNFNYPDCLSMEVQFIE